MKTKGLITILCCFVFIACQNKLTERKAKDLVIQENGFPRPEFEILGSTIHIEGRPEDMNGNVYFKLQSAGLITLQERGPAEINEWGITKTDYFVVLTDKGEKARIEPDNWNVEMRQKAKGIPGVIVVKICDIDFDKITGIQQQTDFESVIEYTTKITNETPFMDVFFNRQDGLFSVVDIRQVKTFNGNMLVRKYNDGWRR